MSDIALKDVNKISECDRMNGSTTNGNFVKPQVDTISVNIDASEKKKMASMIANDASEKKRTASLVDPLTENNGTENTVVEVEYIDSENLKDVEDVEDCAQVR